MGTGLYNHINVGFVSVFVFGTYPSTEINQLKDQSRCAGNWHVTT